jgi:hypothetical protein
MGEMSLDKWSEGITGAGAKSFSLASANYMRRKNLRCERGVD